MPPRVTPRIYHLQIKSHKLSIYLESVAPETKVLKVKEEVLDALQSNSGQNSLDIQAMEPPEMDIQSTNDFELVRQVKDKGRPTGAFELLSPSKALREYGLATWELLFIQFRDNESGGFTSSALDLTYRIQPIVNDHFNNLFTSLHPWAFRRAPACRLHPPPNNG
ncbi:hypothetical protein CVT24_011751 [Panaeolus cyanescens]|uniref:Uncharacterized protein n=1 Tax=Panaeolus cyanescens TaxID=181874 RepID=A0A409VYN4_9AGAR|nr:hypothetical protein CVT24_011751 [Panaeolus cyanescens]